MNAIRMCRAAAALALAAAASVAVAKDPNSYASLLLPADFPPVTPEEKALASVPFAPGAPAVVLFQGRQITQESDLIHTQIYRIEDVRRVKILTQPGIESYANYRYTFYGAWRIHKVQARTILPDGTIVDAKDTTFTERSGKRSGEDAQVQTLRVAFPQVQVGAILDVHVSYVADGTPADRYAIQDRIPVMSRRYMLILPDNLQMKLGSFFLTPEEAKPVVGRSPQGRFFAWNFQNVPPVPDEPNQPPFGDISKALVIYPESIKTDAIYVGIAADWTSWGKDRKDAWDKWLKGKSEQCAALARQVAGDKTDPLDKAEAIRQALRTRMRASYASIYRTADSPDDALAQTNVTSADVAGVAMAMLKAVGVASDAVVFRRRDSGMLPKDSPVITLLEDTIVRLATPKGPAYVAPCDDVPAGVLPREARGVWAMAADGVATAPALLPDYTSAEARATRMLRGSLDAAGTLTGEATITLTGVRAGDWRDALAPLDADARRAWVTQRMAGLVPSARLTAVAFDGLDDGRKDLSVTCTLVAEGFATVAGKRLIANLNVFGRESAADWAAAERKFPVDLGGPHDDNDTVVLTLPAEAVDVAVPLPPAGYDAGNVGKYTASYEKRDKVVILKRTMRLDVYRFPATAFPGLKRWFGDIAAMDDKAIVATLR